jgi:hypothetical protein
MLTQTSGTAGEGKTPSPASAINRAAGAALLAALALVLAGCGAEEEPAENDEDAATWATCTNEADGWTAEYPEDWEVNDGEVVEPCRLFDPEPIELDPAPGEIPLDIAVHLSREQIARDFDDLLEDPFSEELDREETEVDGRTAYRLEAEQTEDGIIPEGTRSVRYVVDLGEDALIAASYDVGDPPLDEKVEVLDEMMERLRFEEPENDVEPGAWEELPDAPIEPRLNHAAAWTDDRMIVWGGGDADAVRADGAAWDPGAEEWRALPEAPIAARWAHHVFWTGDALLVWGGTAGPDHLAECYVDGALYDPVTGMWDEVPAAPGGARCAAAGVWTGDELLVYGGYDAAGPPSPGDLHDDGVAYDVAAGQWRSIPAAPVTARHGAEAAWTGSELVVYGGTGPDVEPLSDGAAYDPATGTWRTIADSPLSPRTGSVSVWIGDALLIFGGRDSEDGGFTDAAAYDPQADSWRELADVPVVLGTAEAVWTGDVAYVLGAAEEEGAAGFLAYVAAEDSWLERPEPPAPQRRNHTLVWSGTHLFLWGGQGEDEPAPPGAVWTPPG